MIWRPLAASSEKVKFRGWLRISLASMNLIIYEDSIIESRDSRMPAKAAKNWQNQAKGLLKAELKRRGLSYADLATKLATIGVNDTVRNISNKVSRGSFTAVFLIQCLEAIGCRTLHLNNEDEQ